MTTLEQNNKQNFFVTLLRGVIALALGLVLTIWPMVSASLFYLLIGVALAVLGIVLVVLYFAKPQPNRLFDRRLTQGLLLIVMGLVLLLMSDSFVALLPIVLSIALIFCGLERLQMGLYLSGLHYSRWWWVLISSALIVALGVLMLVNPFGTGATFVRLYGIFAALEGVLGIVSAFLLRSVTKQMDAAAKGTVE